MRNCITTDILRAYRKKGLLICMGVVILLLTLALVITMVHPFKSMGGTSGTFKSLTSAFYDFNAFLVAIPVFSTVYSDDFKSRSMQTALGFGISRNKMILARFFECLILLIECHVFIMLLTFLYATICGASGVMVGLTGYLWIVALKILGFLCLAMILVYGTQKPTLGLVLFILLNADLFAFIVELIDMIPFLKDNDIKLHNVFPSGMIMNIDDAAHAGKIGETIARIILFIAVYVVVPVIISMRLFRKKELDF